MARKKEDIRPRVQHLNAKMYDIFPKKEKEKGLI
jgi:hypothetical protein